MSVREAGVATYHYPYGDISFNRDGFPDLEFGGKSKTRIGYFGDSIAFGVGAGMGYRLSDRLRHLHPITQHLNFAALGDGLTVEGIARTVELAQRYRLDQVVYLMNLDDILPSRGPDEASAEARVMAALGWVRKEADWLRGKSYLYSYVRAHAVSYFTQIGFGTSGTFAYEFFPRKYPTALHDTAQRIRTTSERLQKQGIRFLVVILPYEMQISNEAARVYAAHGIQWEKGFLAGSPQQALLSELVGIDVLDATGAFVNRDDARERNGLGQFYVYNRGEKLDWNHPNRTGHARLAAFVGDSGLLIGSRVAN